MVRPFILSGAKTVGREALRAGGNILTDIAEEKALTRDIVSKHETESAQNIISKLRGRGRKRTRAAPKNKTKTKRGKVTKRDMFS
jgi:hypothetical protein